MKTLGVKPKSYYLATLHRAENTDEKFRLDNIVCALNEIATSDCPVILPLHPRTDVCVGRFSLEFDDNVHVVQPVSYREMLVLEKNARVVLTDSGGVQKEAYWFHVPCISLREEAEWAETVESGWNILAGTDKHSIINAVRRANKLRPVSSKPIFGNGDAASQIRRILRLSQTVC